MGISDFKDMKVVSFTGKSGTGKSFQATALAQSRGFDAIIDDGLLIYKGQIVAGSSAKKCASKAAAMRTALFNYEDHREEVKAAMEGMIERDDISKIQLNSDYNYTDTAMKYYRYQAVFIVTYY